MAKSVYKLLGPTDKGNNVKQYTVFKFDHMWDHTETYFIDDDGKYLTCTCLAGMKNCRHKKMIPVFKGSEDAAEGRFYNFDKAKWVDMGDKL